MKHLNKVEYSQAVQDVKNTWILSNGFQVELTESVLNNLYSKKQINSTLPESGGVLMGQTIICARKIIIDKITLPYNNDVSKRYFFHRKDKKHQKIIHQEWIKSNNTRIYLGQWHTHPENGIPKPSSLDLKEWKKSFHNDSFELDFLIFIIVGMQEMNLWITMKE